MFDPNLSSYIEDYSILDPNSAFPVICCALILALLTADMLLYKRKTNTKIYPSTVVWECIPIAVLLMYGIFISQQLVLDAETSPYTLHAGIIFVAGLLVLIREPLFRLLFELFPNTQDANKSNHLSPQTLLKAKTATTTIPRFLLHLIITIAVLAGITYITVCALEYPFSPDFFTKIKPDAFWIQIVMMVLIELTLYFLFMRHGLGIAVFVLLMGVFGIANAFVFMIKNSVVLPSDLLAIQTAAAVSGNYTYLLTPPMCMGIACTCFAISLCSWLVPAHALPISTWISLTINLVLGVVLTISTAYYSFGVPYDERNLSVSYCDPQNYYDTQGSLLTFICAIQDIPINQPEGYTLQSTAELEQTYVNSYETQYGSLASRIDAEEQFNEIRPSVVIVMNETFADLSIFDGLHVGYTGPEFFKSMTDNMQTGSLSVSVHGGGTANSEFEFLTETNLLTLGSGKYPYQIYNLKNAPSLAKDFSSLGYETTAIHPGDRGAWNRDVAYQQLGFDKFYSHEDFPESTEVYHSGYSDKATYDMVLEKLQYSDAPQFIFDVTIANHSPYDQDDIPADELTSYQPDFTSQDQTKFYE